MFRRPNGEARPIPEEANIGLTLSIGRPRTVLDVGCGLGLNGAAARLSGARVVGIESDAGKAERAKRLLDEVILLRPDHPDAVGKALGGAKFDLILFPDILERVPNASEFIRRYSEFLEPEGHIILSIRNREAWTVGLNLATPELGYPEGAGGTDGPRLYRQREALDMVSEAGLQVLRIENNPLLARAVRPYLDESFSSSRRHTHSAETAFTDLPVYKAYLALVRPFEVMVAQTAPRWLSFQYVVVARKKPVRRPLSITVGMLTMDEEESIERMILEIRRVAPDAQILLHR